MSSASVSKYKRPVDRYEASARKKDQEFRKNEESKARVKYYNEFERINTHFQVWTAPEYYKQCMDRLQVSKAEKDKEKKLSERKERLRKLLESENFCLREELRIIEQGNKRYNKNKKAPEDAICEIYKQLKIDSEERRRKEIEEGLYQKWRKTEGCKLLEAPDFNEHQALAKMSWLDKQVVKQLEKEKKIKNDIITKNVEIEQMKNELSILLNQQKDMNADRNNLKLQIENEMREYKELEKKYSLIQENEINLKNYVNKFEKIYNNFFKRHEDENQKRNIVLGDMKYQKIQLKQYCEMIINYLNYKIKTINDLRINESNCEKIQDVLTSALSVFQKQFKIETGRKQQISVMYDSEVRRVWSDFFKKWENEEKNQYEVTVEILDMLKKNAEDKFQTNLRTQKEYIENKEKLLKSMEDVNYKISLLEKDIEAILIQIDVLKKNVINEESKNNMLSEYLSEFDKIDNKSEERKFITHTSFNNNQSSTRISRYNDAIKDIICNTFKPQSIF